MVQVLSKFKTFALTAGLGFTVTGVLYLAYRLHKEGIRLDEIQEQAVRKDDSLKTLLDSLESDNDDTVLNALHKLNNLTAFKEFQISIRKCHGIERIKALLSSNSVDVKLQTLNVLNNLAMDMENQLLLRETITTLIDMLVNTESSSDDITLAVLRVLTNMTTLDENHIFVLPHLATFCILLEIDNPKIQLQILKILVNLSTNSQNTSEVIVQIVNAVSQFIRLDVDEEILLRAVTSLENSLRMLKQNYQKRYKENDLKSEVAPVDMRVRLKDLTHHQNMEVCMKTNNILTYLDSFPSFALNDFRLIHVDN